MLLSDWISKERGRGAALARHLKVPSSMVTRMASGKKQVPVEQCPFIQEFTKNDVTCEEMRPDKAEYFALIRSQASAAAASFAAIAISMQGDGAVSPRAAAVS